MHINKVIPALAMSVVLGASANAAISPDPGKPKEPPAAAAKAEAAAKQVTAPIERRIAAAQRELQQGLMTSKSFGTANTHFMNAKNQLEAAQRAITAAERRRGVDGVLVEKLGELERRTDSALIQTLLDAGSIALVRGQFSTALGHVNHVLAIDPGNEDARAMRARIEISANESATGGSAFNGQKTAHGRASAGSRF